MKQFIYVILIVALLFGTIVYQEYKIVNLEKQTATIDSLNAEIQLRDILLSKCKDTLYGEEVIETTRQNQSRPLSRNDGPPTRYNEYNR